MNYYNYGDLMETIEIHDYNEFIANIHTIGVKGRIFRGVSNKEYSLQPCIGRFYNKGDYKRLGLNHFFSIEKRVFEKFKREIWSYVTKVPKDDWEYLALAQNHGLPTRFLDWTFKPTIALFFAVENITPQYLQKDGAVFSATDLVDIDQLYNIVLKKIKPSPFEYQQIIQDISESKQIRPDISGKLNDVIGYTPTHTSLNIPAQDGAMLYFLEPQKSTKIPDYKFIIKKEAKYSILNELCNNAIERKRLFPGIDGICSSLKTQHYEMIYDDQ